MKWSPHRDTNRQASLPGDLFVQSVCRMCRFGLGYHGAKLRAPIDGLRVYLVQWDVQRADRNERGNFVARADRRRVSDQLRAERDQRPGSEYAGSRMGGRTDVYL